MYIYYNLITFNLISTINIEVKKKVIRQLNYENIFVVLNITFYMILNLKIF